MKPTSCIFWYAKRAYRYNEQTKKPEPIINPDGTQRANDNYISFLQVISCYWEASDEPNNPENLNIFLNGGSVSVDRNGDRQSKSGYTLVLPQHIGRKFITEFYNWSVVFGLNNVQATAPVLRSNYQERSERSEGPRHNRNIRPDDFVDPSEIPAGEAVFE